MRALLPKINYPAVAVPHLELSLSHVMFENESERGVCFCGYYMKTLLWPCDPARKSQEVCSSGSEDSKSTGGLCYLSGCDRKARPRREGPSRLDCAYTALLSRLMPSRNLPNAAGKARIYFRRTCWVA